MPLYVHPPRGKREDRWKDGQRRRQEGRQASGGAGTELGHRTRGGRDWTCRVRSSLSHCGPRSKADGHTERRAPCPARGRGWGWAPTTRLQGTFSPGSGRQKHNPKHSTGEWQPGRRHGHGNALRSPSGGLFWGFTRPRITPDLVCRSERQRHDDAALVNWRSDESTCSTSRLHCTALHCSWREDQTPEL